MNSSTSGPKPESIKVGYVRRAHGIKGAVVVRVLGDEEAQFAVGSSIATDNRDYPSLSVVSSQSHKDGLLVAFDAIESRNDSETLRGTSFFVMPQDRRQLDVDEFWPEQLIGLQVTDPTGRDVGVVADLVAGAAQDRIVVETEEGTFEVPFVAALVPTVDLEAGVVVIDVPEGLLDV